MLLSPEKLHLVYCSFFMQFIMAKEAFQNLQLAVVSQSIKCAAKQLPKCMQTKRDFFLKEGCLVLKAHT